MPTGVMPTRVMRTESCALRIAVRHLFHSFLKVLEEFVVRKSAFRPVFYQVLQERLALTTVLPYHLSVETVTLAIVTLATVTLAIVSLAKITPTRVMSGPVIVTDKD